MIKVSLNDVCRIGIGIISIVPTTAQMYTKIQPPIQATKSSTTSQLYAFTWIMCFCFCIYQSTTIGRVIVSRRHPIHPLLTPLSTKGNQSWPQTAVNQSWNAMKNPASRHVYIATQGQRWIPVSNHGFIIFQSALSIWSPSPIPGFVFPRWRCLLGMQWCSMKELFKKNQKPYSKHYSAHPTQHTNTTDNQT